MNYKTLFTSEQVSKGHPDKMCDQISDAILDACLRQDPESRVAIETLIKNYDVVVAGELTTKANIDVNAIVEAVVTNVDAEYAGKYKVTNLIDKQSSDIAMGVDTGGAGDQGIMFGFATSETPEMMPLAWVLATKALRKLDDIRKTTKFLKSDAKSQVTIDYSIPGHPSIDTFLVSIQHTEDTDMEQLRETVTGVMKNVAKEHGLNTDFKILINPTGRFVIGGSVGDAGVTGRKIIADTYGGYAKHGGGAFSGKDPSKVDRSAAYMARYLARWALKGFGINTCEVQLSYAIGVKQPVSISVILDGEESPEIASVMNQSFDLTPQGIIKFLDLRNTKYLETTCYGHFGKDHLSWERV